MEYVKLGDTGLAVSRLCLGMMSYGDPDWRPWILPEDDDTPIDETLEALHDAVRLGYVRYVGASSMHAWQFARALYRADLNGWSRFISMQNHYNLLYREEEREMMPLCGEEGIGVLPWSPLARGWLTRPPGEKAATRRGESDDFAPRLYDFPEADEIIRRVGRVAEKRGVSRAQVALAWLLGRPGVTAPIVGATKMEHLEDALGVLDVELDDEEVGALEEPYPPRPVRGHR